MVCETGYCRRRGQENNLANKKGGEVSAVFAKVTCPGGSAAAWNSPSHGPTGRAEPRPDHPPGGWRGRLWLGRRWGDRTCKCRRLRRGCGAAVRRCRQGAWFRLLRRRRGRGDGGNSIPGGRRTRG